MSRPLQILIKSYNFYRDHCKAIGRKPKMFKNLHKSELDDAFGVYKEDKKVKKAEKRKNSTSANPDPSSKKPKKISLAPGRLRSPKKRKNFSTSSMMHKKLKSNFDMFLF